MARSMKELVAVLSGWMSISLCFPFSCGPACAGGIQSIVPKHTFGFGVGASYFCWEEDFPSGDVEMDGLMYEVVGTYTYHNGIMIDANLDYRTGDLDYDGYVQRLFAWSGGELVPYKENSDSQIVECRGLIGYDYVFRGRNMVTPFLGIGYRCWNDDGKGPYGFERDVEYWYSPVGVKTHSPLSDNWTWGMSFEYDLLWEGEVDNHLPYRPTLNIDSGYGARLSLRFSTPLTKNAVLSFEPYITYWDIDESDVEVYTLPDVGLIETFEPESNITSYGLRMSVEF